MARKGFEGGQANSFDALNVGEGGKVIVDANAPEKTLENILPPVEESKTNTSHSVEITDVLDSDEEFKSYLGDKKGEKRNRTKPQRENTREDEEGPLDLPEPTPMPTPEPVPTFDPEKYRAGVDKTFKGSPNSNLEGENNKITRPSKKATGPKPLKPLKKLDKYFANKIYDEDFKVTEDLEKAIATTVFDKDPNARKKRTKPYESLEDIVNEKYPESNVEVKVEEERKEQEEKRDKEVERAKKVAAKSAEVLRLMENSELSGQGTAELVTEPKVESKSGSVRRSSIGKRSTTTVESSKDPVLAPGPVVEVVPPTPKPEAKPNPEPAATKKAEQQPAAKEIHFDKIENGKGSKTNTGPENKQKNPITIDIDAEVRGVPLPKNESQTRTPKPAEPQTPYVEPKGAFSRFGNWLADISYRPILEGTKRFAAFQAERVKSFGSLIKADFLGNRQLVKREGAIAKHEIADTEVKQILAGLKSIDDYRNNNQLSPRQARKMEKEFIALNKQLTKTQERRATALAKVKKHENLGLVQENKKKQIAENFAHIVGERLSPRTEKFDNLMGEKNDLTNEIKTWGEEIAEDAKELKALKEIMSANKYMNTSANKAKVKEIEANLANAYKKREYKKSRLNKVDTKLVKHKSVFDKWDNKKQAYNRYAKERIEIFDPAKKRAPEPGAYRDPATIGTEDNFENEEDGPISARPTNSQREERGSQGLGAENKASNEGPGSYEFDQWANAWNKLYGSEVKVRMEDVMPEDMVVANRRNKTAFNRNQFAVLVKNSLVQKGDKRGGGNFDSNFSLDRVSRVLKSDEAKKASAAAVGSNI